eukprot:696858-Pyramimonas_sp.AAC.1
MQLEELWIGSKRWERKQDAIAARRYASGDNGSLLRDYSVLIHARGQIELKAFMRMRVLFFDSRLWGLVRESEMNNMLKADVFTGVSAAGALVQKLIATPHELAPFR